MLEIQANDIQDVYAFIGNNRGVAADIEGTTKRNEWVKLNVELAGDEVIRKLSYRSELGGGNNIVLLREDQQRLMSKLYVLCDAMIADKEQKEAWKQLLKTTYYEWYDEIFNRYNLIIDHKTNKPE